MTQKNPPDAAVGEKTSKTATIPAPASGALASLGAGLGAIYAALARLTLSGLEDISDRRAQNRAAHLSRRAKAVRAKTLRAAGDQP